MKKPKLFMLLLGCKPDGRHTEQHDVFFGIATELRELKSEILNFWPEAEGTIHIDAWREVTYVNEYLIKPTLRSLRVNDNESQIRQEKLFFLNLGGYKINEFEEYHYKFLTVAKNQRHAAKEAKQTLFYKHFDVPSAPSHIDDQYGIDVDDLYEVEEILPLTARTNYKIETIPAHRQKQDKIHLGYLKLNKL